MRGLVKKKARAKILCRKSCIMKVYKLGTRTQYNINGQMEAFSFSCDFSKRDKKGNEY